MARVLLIGQIPETVDFTDPAIPPGMSVERVVSGLATSMQAMRDRGWHADQVLVSPDDTASKEIDAWLRSHDAYDCIVIGAGIRVPPKSVWLFEQVINAVHRAAPGSVIAFNTRPDDTANAAARWLSEA